MTYPDWAGALVYWLSNHPDLLDPATGGAPTVAHVKPAGDVPARPSPLVVVRKEPGFAHDYVPIAEPRAGLYTYHSTEKNAQDLMVVLLDVLGPWRHGGPGMLVEMPASLGADKVRFNGFRLAATPFTERDEGWPMCYCPVLVNIHAAVLP